MNGKPVDSVPMLVARVDSLRGRRHRDAGPAEREQRHDRGCHRHGTAASDRRAGRAGGSREAFHPRLGIIGVDVDDATPTLLPGLRIPSGVFVAARTQVSSEDDVPLVAGDVIHAMNSFAVRSVDGLRVLVDDVKANSAFVLQIERNGQLQFVTCQIY